jgi:hypothetical protein
MLDYSYGMTAFVLMCSPLELAQQWRQKAGKSPHSEFFSPDGWQKWQNSYEWWLGYYMHFLKPLGTGLLVVNPALSLKKKVNLVLQYARTTQAIGSGVVNYRREEALIRRVESNYEKMNTVKPRKRREP